MSTDYLRTRKLHRLPLLKKKVRLLFHIPGARQHWRRSSFMGTVKSVTSSPTLNVHFHAYVHDFERFHRITRQKALALKPHTLVRADEVAGINIEMTRLNLESAAVFPRCQENPEDKCNYQLPEEVTTETKKSLHQIQEFSRPQTNIFALHSTFHWKCLQAACVVRIVTTNTNVVAQGCPTSGSRSPLLRKIISRHRMFREMPIFF